LGIPFVQLAGLLQMSRAEITFALQAQRHDLEFGVVHRCSYGLLLAMASRASTFGMVWDRRHFAFRGSPGVVNAFSVNVLFHAGSDPIWSSGHGISLVSKVRPSADRYIGHMCHVAKRWGLI
jgi:hypothetical protein